MSLPLDTSPLGGRLEEVIRRDGLSAWALSHAGTSAIVLGPIPDRQFRAETVKTLSRMLVGFDPNHTDTLLRDRSVRIVSGVDDGAATRLVETLGRQRTNGHVVSASAPIAAPNTIASRAKSALLAGGGAAAAAFLFVEPITLMLVALAGGAAGAFAGGAARAQAAVVDATPRMAPDVPSEVRNIPHAIGGVFQQMDDDDANALEAIERFAFYLLGRLSDPSDLLNALGGVPSELGQSALALALAAMDVAEKQKYSALAAASARVSTHREALAEAEGLSDGALINERLDALTEAVRTTVSGLSADLG